MAERFQNLWITMLVVLIFGSGIAFPGAAGDEDVFTAQVAPNVVLMVDNSGSMNAIMEHEAFDAASFTPACEALPSGGSGFQWIQDDNGVSTAIYCWSTFCTFWTWSGQGGWQATPDSSDPASSGYVERTFCGQTRKLYNDGLNEGYGNYTWYYPEHANWLFNLDDSDNVTLYGPAGSQVTAPQILAEIDDPSNGTTYIDGQTFAKYQIARITAARDIARDVIYQTNSDCPAFLGDCGVYEDRVRFGIAQFHRSAHGGFVNAPIDEYSANRTDIESAITSLDAQTATPLGETLFKLYTYFMPRTTSDIPFGKNGTTRFPAYVYNTWNGDYTSTSSSRPDDPVSEACQKNFIIMITDGEPSWDNFNGSGSNMQGFLDFRDRLIGDYAPDDPGDPDIGTDSTPEEGVPPWSFSSGTGYLDDVALFMQQNDCRPDFPNETNVVDVYTVGFTTTGPVNSLLEKTAANGNGLYFNGNQAEELTEALVQSVQDIISKSQSFSAATVPAARTADGGNLYTTLFQPTSARPFWPGLLRSYKITASGEIHDRDGNCALEDLSDPPNCTGGTFKSESEAPPFWSASKEMPAANARNLKVSLAGTSSQIVADFDHLLSESDLGSLGAVSEYPPSTNVSSTGDLDEAVVAYVAGCEWGSGMSSSGSDNFSGCTDRTRVENGLTQPDRLGDIFHSNPIVIGSPNSFIDEVSYGEFASDVTYARRDRIIIAGANDGFLHGFNAGVYQTSSTPVGYDEGTGAEVFGFMPWGARTRVKDMAKDDATLHSLSVDGSPAVADVWIDSNSTPDDSKLASEWKTVLVTGMREGGEHYLALDVSNPADANYPDYMWEFPIESDSTWRSYVGQTWSQPVITRVRMENASEDVREVWVAIVGFGYDPTSDPNDEAQYDAVSLKGRGLMMIEMETGRPIAVRKYGTTATGDVSDMLYAIPSSPGVLDYDQDGFADVIYVGDLGGNVWKWVVRANGTDNPSSGELHQSDWSFRKFFDHDPTSAADARARSFFFAPSATIVNGILHLGIGSGERANLNCSSTLSGCTLMNRFYLLKDRDVWDSGSPAAIDGRVAPTGDLSDVTADEANCPAVEPSGFYFEVDDGEKFVTNSEIFNAFFFVSSFKPDLVNLCEPGGISTLYGFLAKCGQGFFGPPSSTSPIAGTDRSIDLGNGMPTDARISIAPGEGGNRLIISKQDGELVNIDSGSAAAEHGTMYWREID